MRTTLGDSGDAGDRRWEELSEQRALAMNVVGGLFFGAIVLTRLVGIVQAGRVTASILASLVLLAVTFALLLMWGWATKKELGLLRQVGRGQIPPLPGSSFPLVVLAAVMLGALGVATTWPLVFALLYLGLKVVEAVGYRKIFEMVDVGLTKVRVLPLDEDHASAADALDHYYLRQSWRRLQVSQVALSVVATAMATAALLTGDEAMRDSLDLASYLVLIGTVVMNEAVVARWRSVRAQELPEHFR